jgi:tetratricopeptide (TPR) repeat protein
VLDAGSRGRQEDPLVGFSRIQPLFELDEDDDVYRTARSRQLFFGQQQFAREKPEGTFRIFGLGGSTLRGRPYETDTSFLKWLEIELSGRDSTRHYQTVNCGGLSYASYRLALILDEVLQYEPDLIIIATGHNEFLEDRTYDSIKNRSPLASWVSERLHSLRTVTLARQLCASYHRDDEWRSDVIEHFELSVRGMVDTCRQARVPLVLVNLGENLRDCPPFKSEHKPGLSARSLQRWQEFFDTATESEQVSPEDALQAYRKAESIDDQYALLIYRMARCFDRLGEMQQARRYYARAKDLDICPLRMLDEMHERLKRIAGDSNVPLVNAQQLLVELSPDEIPGNNCFMDHVHPAIGSHQRIARALALKLGEMSLVTGNRKWDDGQRRVTYRRHFRQLGPAYLTNGRRRVGWLEDWAHRHRLDEEIAPKDARGHLHLGQKRLDYGEYNLAWEQFRFAMEQNPGLAGDVFDYALGLFKEGRGDLAEEILLRLHYQPEAATLRPQTELAYLILALDAGRTGEAETIYNRHRDAVEQAARSSRGWLDVIPDALDQMKAKVGCGSPQPGAEPAADPFDYGVARHGDDLDKTAPPDVKALQLDPKHIDARVVSSGQQADKEKAAAGLDVAIRLLDEAIRRDPDNSRLYLSRARFHVAKRDFDAALQDSSKAVQLAPDDAAGYNVRAVVYTIQGKLKEAVADLTKAIDIDPSDPDVFRVRGSAYQRLGEDAKAEADFAAARKLAEGG